MPLGVTKSERIILAALATLALAGLVASILW